MDNEVEYMLDIKHLWEGTHPTWSYTKNKRAVKQKKLWLTVNNKQHRCALETSAVEVQRNVHFQIAGTSSPHIHTRHYMPQRFQSTVAKVRYFRGSSP